MHCEEDYKNPGYSCNHVKARLSDFLIFLTILSFCILIN